MKSSEILREAAKRVEDGEADYGCCALDNVCIDLRDKLYDECSEGMAAMKRFMLVGPPKRGAAGPWWGGWVSAKQDKHRNARIIGLCLAAAIAESEGD